MSFASCGAFSTRCRSSSRRSDLTRACAQRIAAEPKPRWFRWLVPQPRLAFSMALLLALSVWIARLPQENSGLSGTAPTEHEQFQVIKNLDVLENYDVLSKLDALDEVPADACRRSARPAERSRSTGRRRINEALRLICGLALALMMALAAQPAWARRPHGSAPAPRSPSMRAAPPRPGAAGHPNARPGPRPAFRAPYNARPTQAQAAPRATQRPNAGANANQGGMKGLSPGVKQNLRDMSPQEQQRYMQNNERFRSLPPQQQAQIRNNLQKWNNLSPTERNAMNDRARTWQRMSPQQRQYVQSNLLPKWQQHVSGTEADRDRAFAHASGDEPVRAASGAPGSAVHARTESGRAVGLARARFDQPGTSVKPARIGLRTRLVVSPPQPRTSEKLLARAWHPRGAAALIGRDAALKPQRRCDSAVTREETAIEPGFSCC